MMWIIAIIILFIIYKYITGQNSATYSKNNRSSYTSTSDSDELASARSLCRAYEKALGSQNKAQLMQIVDDMIGYHWSSVYGNDLDSAILYEGVAKSHPFLYPADGSRDSCRGLLLYEIFINQNIEIKARKEGKAPYTTPPLYKPRR